MAEMRTRGGPTGDEPPFDPPRADEGIDDWFARRLEAQGISAGRRRVPIARVLALGALLVTLGVFGWILNGASSKSTTASTTTPKTHSNTTPGGSTTTGTTKTKAKKPPWQRIPITVLNGFGGTNAAGTAKAELQKAGWKIVSVADAGTSTTQTIVVFVPGKLALARIVARRLGLPAPVPIAQALGAGGVAQTDNVAIVLGPNLLPNGAGNA